MFAFYLEINRQKDELGCQLASWLGDLQLFQGLVPLNVKVGEGGGLGPKVKSH